MKVETYENPQTLIPVARCRVNVTFSVFFFTALRCSKCGPHDIFDLPEIEIHPRLSPTKQS